jgi:two-component system CheB/CheR fusion protein
LIVGIGASAGGLEAFKTFLKHTPANTGMAFVLVQHLSPDHNSMLTELLSRVTDMDVVEAADRMEVMPNCVFVIPPNATLTIQGGHLKVTRPAPPRISRRPIDTFFQSLATDKGENAVAVILSGTGSDGALGLASVKEHGGLTLAQAEFDHHALPGMPQSAAATGQVDTVLAVEAIPARLIAYSQHLAGVANLKDSDGFRQDAASQMETIIGALRARSGHDFSEYKEKTLLRRLQRRMQVLHVETPGPYIERFREQPEELDALFRELLIGVTEFFRDPLAWEALAATVIKDLVAGKQAADEIRVWVPGCSTGQEAYTMAILIREAMDTSGPRPKVQIFGTDIDDRAIALARLGRYRKPVAGLSEERLDRWFSDDGRDHCVIPEIREMCVFSVHSIIKHPPFSKLDLISCRNLLIYIDADLQDRIMRTFHYSLKPHGSLFLGSSESVTSATRLFSVKDKKHRIFERREVEGAQLPELSGISRRLDPQATREATPTPGPPDDRLDKASRRVAEKYTPPHVVIDSRDQIVRFSGAAMGRFVELSPGAPSFGLFDILRKALRPAARAALKDARASKAAVRQENVSIRIDGAPHLITLIAEPVADHGPDVSFIIMVFQDSVAGVPDKSRAAGGGNDAVMALEQELRTTRVQLQSTIDDLEVANEELKSSNEEHQSVNEELQSSNEELETAKEEMQSVNEEIQTINSEMISKNEQLVTLNSDLKNLFESTEIATLFLDGQLRVKSFTPGITEIFHLRDADIGRPVTEIVSQLDYAGLQRDVKTVLRKLTLIEQEVKLKETGATFVLRIRPYRTVENVIEGVVLTFVDISARHAADESLRQSEARFRGAVDAVEGIVWTNNAAGEMSGEQPGWAALTGQTPAEYQRFGWTQAVHPEDAQSTIEAWNTAVVAKVLFQFEHRVRRQDGEWRHFSIRAAPIFDRDHRVLEWVGVHTDITAQKDAEAQMALLVHELDHRVKNLFSIVAGIITLSGRYATTPQELVETVQGRLSALAASHRFISPRQVASGDATQSTTLGELVGTILSPYINTPALNKTARVVMEGPDTPIRGEAVTSFAMILHELATNAVKYGAFSVPAGQVLITWTVQKGQFSLTWEERGGPKLKGPPERQGFGTLLVRQSVNGTFNGQLTYHWHTDGLMVHLTTLVERLT